MVNKSRNAGELYHRWNLENPQYSKSLSERKIKTTEKN